MSHANIIIKVLQFCLCLIFIIAGYAKIKVIYTFQSVVETYIELYVPFRLNSYIMAWGISILEIVLGLTGTISIFSKNLYFHIQSGRIISLCLMILLIIFTYFTGINALFPTELGSVESCGCFGEWLHFSPVAAFIRNLVLLIISTTIMLWYNMTKL